MRHRERACQGPARVLHPGEDYVACLPDNSSGAVLLAAFSAAHEGPLTPEACSAFCFAAGQSLGALSDQGWCLCGAAQPPNASAACLPFCSSTPSTLAPACRGPTILQDTFPASPGAALLGPQGPLSSGQPAAFRVTASLPIRSTRWDFGDGSPRVDVAGAATTHRYVLPGRYHVTAVLAVGAGSAQLEAEVRVEAAPAALELSCLVSVRSNETLKLGVRNRGGSDLQAAYSIVAVDEEPARGGCPRPGPGPSLPSLTPGGWSGGGSVLVGHMLTPLLCPLTPPVVHPLCPPDTVIFPDNGHCYRLVAEKAAWLQAQEQCRAWAGAALAMVDSPAVQRFLVSQVTRYPPPTPERLSGGGPHNAGAGLEERWGWPEARVQLAGLMAAEDPVLLGGRYCHQLLGQRCGRGGCIQVLRAHHPCCPH